MKLSFGNALQKLMFYVRIYLCITAHRTEIYEKNPIESTVPPWKMKYRMNSVWSMSPRRTGTTCGTCIIVLCVCVWFWLHNNSWPTTRVDSSKRKQQRKRLVYSCEPIMDYNCLWYCWKTQNESILFSAGYELIALLDYVWGNHPENYEQLFLSIYGKLPTM